MGGPLSVVMQRNCAASRPPPYDQSGRDRELHAQEIRATRATLPQHRANSAERFGYGQRTSRAPAVYALQQMSRVHGTGNEALLRTLSLSYGVATA